MCAFALSNCEAFTVLPLESALLSSENGIWQPSGGIMLKEGVACARANQGDCENCVNETVAVCTFDYGKHFSIHQTKFPFCGNRGVVVDGKLLCPLNNVSVNASATNFTVVSYEGQSSLVETVEEGTMLSFVYWPGEEMVKIEFKGNSIHFPEDNTYFMNAVVTHADSSTNHILFASTDGYTWKASSEVPLEVNEKSAIIREARQKIKISNFTSSEHHFVSSGHKGRWWDSIKSLNVSVPPASVVFSSGVVIESGMTNISVPLKLTATVNGNSKKKVLNLIDLYKNVTGSSQIPENFANDCKDGKSCLTSSYVSLMKVNDSHIVAMFDFIPLNSQRHSLAIISLEIDDSEEKNKILEEKRKAEENARIREEAWKKAQEENAERKRNERREKRRKERERRERFVVADAENIALATSRFVEDGEMIVVRDVFEDMIDIEKSTFFW
ncbi:uncharacterized protein TM35_000033970 [Trypanosoma theileri]|uniref:Uncharacterized protein n=1 Tax=Trypanosoma theileri TaxID=67003 RepID=A0A1X0P6U2_9TRYP|nr:uncharacterized protein TM35_000033970 [Trypanosoma theileri]ORC92644.1 hypothetical protein TM35_000033970 [Trypanosoma theileri]